MDLALCCSSTSVMRASPLRAAASSAVRPSLSAWLTLAPAASSALTEPRCPNRAASSNACVPVSSVADRTSAYPSVSSSWMHASLPAAAASINAVLPVS
eukprot:CAMPEP_0202863690 /NCGR_PEP_ID=MMETSP1391-20130828/4227_1 /ASSEMBLY_ACC=CAM_ASM_000867 /TAXON_ID=1034604 /ORGANISM="Chlamydomonas leiostraca, Strain SAG 11-49" /LENGTH=98 /DNA_ID=CAMNT_0049543349 /DNA_START=870 /DNA_END=1166 /DNA_ORIENTATION=-